MIEPTSRLSALAVVAEARTPVAAAPGRSSEPTPASEPFNLSGTAVAARALSAAPPVDLGKVAALKSAIASGSYVLDPEAIATKMIALDLPPARDS